MVKQLFIGLLMLISIKGVSQNSTQNVDTIPMYCPVEVMPQFPGGNVAMMKFISENLKWPEILNGSCIEGRVVVKFVVEPSGELSDIKVVRSLEKYLDEEAIRVIKLMPKWIPGKIKGVEAPCYYTLPVIFKVTR